MIAVQTRPTFSLLILETRENRITGSGEAFALSFKLVYYTTTAQIADREACGLPRSAI